MFSITLKRSAATLGVVAAGLLAAAAPASAQVMPGMIGVTAPKAPTTPTADAFIIDFANTGVKAPIKAVVVLIGANDYGFADGTQIGIED